MTIINKLLLFLALLPLFAVSADAASILYIGDSHSYVQVLELQENQRRLGDILIAGLQSSGADQLSYYAASGSSPESWATGGATPYGYTAFMGGKFFSTLRSDFPSISQIFPQKTGAQLVVNLGDNIFRWEKSGDKSRAVFDGNKFTAQMQSFFAKIAWLNQADCTWIGPTYHIEGATYKKSNEAVDQLYAALNDFLKNKCRLIDSRPLVVAKNPGDGLHHTSSDSRIWAQGILREWLKK